MPRWPEKKVVKSDGTVKKPDNNAVVKFYCTKGQYTFAMPVYERDGFGEIITQNGRPKKLIETDSDGNNRHGVFESFKFDRLPIKDPKTGKTSAMVFIGVFAISPEFPNRWSRKEELVDYLALAAKNVHTGIMTEDQYKKFHNPEAYTVMKEKEDLAIYNAKLAEENFKLKAKLSAAGVVNE
jgi:hypothetical protein